MFDAVGDHVVARPGLPRDIDGADDIAPMWITVSEEECGLSAEDARRGIAWAIDTLVGALRQEHQQQETEH